MARLGWVALLKVAMKPVSHPQGLFHALTEGRDVGHVLVRRQHHHHCLGF